MLESKNDNILNNLPDNTLEELLEKFSIILNGNDEEIKALICKCDQTIFYDNKGPNTRFYNEILSKIIMSFYCKYKKLQLNQKEEQIAFIKDEINNLSSKLDAERPKNYLSLVITKTLEKILGLIIVILFILSNSVATPLVVIELLTIIITSKVSKDMREKETTISIKETILNKILKETEEEEPQKENPENLEAASEARIEESKQRLIKAYEEEGLRIEESKQRLIKAYEEEGLTGGEIALKLKELNTLITETVESVNNIFPIDRENPVYYIEYANARIEEIIQRFIKAYEEEGLTDIEIALKLNESRERIIKACKEEGLTALISREEIEILILNEGNTLILKAGDTLITKYKDFGTLITKFKESANSIFPMDTKYPIKRRIPGNKNNHNK